MSYFFYSPVTDRARCRISCKTPVPEVLSIDYPWYQPIDPFSDPPLDHSFFGHPYTGHEVFPTPLVHSNDTLRCFPPAPTGLPADILPGSTASLGGPGLLNPCQGIDQVNFRLANAQSSDSNDMVEAPFIGGAHANIEARLTTPSALRSVQVDKPDEADDKITGTNIYRFLGNYDKACACLNCLAKPFTWEIYTLSDRFPALQYISCRIEGCTWNEEKKYPDCHIVWAINRMASHEASHFRAETRDQDGKLIYTCTNDHCRIRTKRKDDVKRHYATVHCKNPERFPCHVIGCPFSGKNGFTRKDKLTNHMKSTHKGLPFPGKCLQAIKPKTGVSNAGVHKAGSQA